MRTSCLLFAIIPCAAVPTNALAQDTKEELIRVRQEVKALQERVATLEAHIRILNAKTGTEARPPQPVSAIAIDTRNSPFRGRADAPVTIVEFSDYQCPFCARAFRDIYSVLDSTLVKGGTVKYVFKDFPIVPLHPRAVDAAEAAYCAGDQGKYWEMHEQLFANQSDFAEAALLAHANAIGLKANDFASCLASDKHSARIAENMRNGQRLSVRGTPTFIIGRTNPATGKVIPVRVVTGAKSLGEIRAAVQDLTTQTTKR